MYSYIKGLVVEINSNNIVIDNNDIGYKIHIPNPFSFEINKEYKVYLFQYIREDENTLYGFKTEDEKDLFLKLIEVSGVGPKMALPIIATGSVNGIKDAINRENILYLKKFPKIGEKIARQIILDLKGKFKDVEITHYDEDELIEVLKGLGYKNNDIFKVIPKIDKELDLETKIKEALKLLLK